MDFLEVRRQLVHMAGGILLVILLYLDLLDFRSIALLLLISSIVFFLAKKRKLPLLNPLLKKLERKEYRKRFPGKGLIFYLLGAFVVVILFEKDIVLASIMILALGDSVSPLVGRLGKIPHLFNKKKYFEGVLAGSIAGFIGALFFVAPIEAFLASFIAMIIEGMDLKVDDNLVLPVVASLIIWFLRLL